MHDKYGDENSSFSIVCLLYEMSSRANYTSWNYTLESLFAILPTTRLEKPRSIKEWHAKLLSKQEKSMPLTLKYSLFLFSESLSQRCTHL